MFELYADAAFNGYWNRLTENPWGESRPERVQRDRLLDVAGWLRLGRPGLPDHALLPDSRVAPRRM